MNITNSQKLFRGKSIRPTCFCNINSLLCRKSLLFQVKKTAILCYFLHFVSVLIYTLDNPNAFSKQEEKSNNLNCMYHEFATIVTHLKCFR